MKANPKYQSLLLVFVVMNHIFIANLYRSTLVYEINFNCLLPLRYNVLDPVSTLVPTTLNLIHLTIQKSHHAAALNCFRLRSHQPQYHKPHTIPLSSHPRHTTTTRSLNTDHDYNSHWTFMVITCL